MKKLALMLAALTAVSAVASAKEIVVAPAVVEEVVVLAPAPVWRPSGFVGFQAKYYGRGDRHYRVDGEDQVTYNYIRTQLEGAVDFTENSKLELRVRNYANLHEEDYAHGTASTKQNNARFRYIYDHGNLGDTKIDFKSRVEYYNNVLGKGDSHSLGYQARFDFAEYVEHMTALTLIPHYEYVKIDNGNSNYSNNVGLDLETYTELPLGFELEVNLYADYYSYGDQANYMSKNGVMKDSQFTFGAEAYIYRNFDLYQDDKNSLVFTTELGYESYNLYEKYKSYSVALDFNGELIPDQYIAGNKSYQAYAILGLELTHKVNNNFKVYAWGGAEYRNWSIADWSSASHWSWQPQVTLGFKVNF